MRYSRGMIDRSLSLTTELQATVPAPHQEPLLAQLTTLRRENAALRAQNAVLEERIRELEARLGKNSSNSSRPPSSDPPQAPREPQSSRQAASEAASQDTVGPSAGRGSG